MLSCRTDSRPELGELQSLQTLHPLDLSISKNLQQEGFLIRLADRWWLMVLFVSLKTVAVDRYWLGRVTSWIVSPFPSSPGTYI